MGQPPAARLTNDLARQVCLRKQSAAYQDFFAPWKDADPQIPILRQAKADYAKLK
jgi:hypothetical protein